MDRRVLMGLLAAVAGVASIVMVGPMIPWPANNDTEAPVAPEFGSTVAVENARLVLPPRAGQHASLFLEIENVGDQGIYLTEIAIQHAQRVGIVEIRGPDPMRVSNVHIDQGETLRFGPDTRFRVVSDYDENVVPGAVVEVRLTFGNAATMNIMAPVTLDNPHTRREESRVRPEDRTANFET